MRRTGSVCAMVAFLVVLGCLFNSQVSGAEVKATVIGKIWVSSNTATFKVAEAKTEDGKVISELKDKLLRIVGPKANDAVRMAGKEVEIKGVIRENIELEPTTITLRPAPKK